MIPAVLRTKIILSVNRALLGEVFCQLRAVACEVSSEKEFELVFFVTCPINEEQIEALSCIETEVIADFPDSFDITHSIVTSVEVDVSSDGFLIFLKKL